MIFGRTGQASLGAAGAGRPAGLDGPVSPPGPPSLPPSQARLPSDRSPCTFLGLRLLLAKPLASRALSFFRVWNVPAEATAHSTSPRKDPSSGLARQGPWTCRAQASKPGPPDKLLAK